MRFSLMYLKSQRSIDQISSTQHCFQDSQSAKGWVPSLQWDFNVSWGNTEQIEKTRGHTAHIGCSWNWSHAAQGKGHHKAEDCSQGELRGPTAKSNLDDVSTSS